MTSRIKAFKSQSGPLPEPVGEILQRLATKPPEIHVNGSSLELAIKEAHRLGAFIPSMTADRASYGLRLSWPSDSSLNGGILHQLNRKADDARQNCGNTTQREPRRAQSHHSENITEPTTNPEKISNSLVVPDPNHIESVLERIRAGAERNRRNAALERRFKRP